MAACKLDKATCREPQAVPRRSCALSRLWHAILWVNMFHMLKNSVHKMKEFELGSILRGSRREQELGMWVRPNCFGYPCGRTVTCPPHSPSLLAQSLDQWDNLPEQSLYFLGSFTATMAILPSSGHWKSEYNFWVCP